MNNSQGVFSTNLFADKVFVITGAGQGIGLSIADNLRHLSATVVVLEHPRVAREMVQPNVRAVDLSDADALQAIIPDIVKDYGRCDGLINNARAGYRTLPLEERADNLLDSINVGLIAPTLLSQQFIHYAEEATTISRSIVNISSTAARRISAESASYHMTKAALENLTQYLAVYAGKSNVRVNAVAPGFIVKDEHHERFNRDDNQNYHSMALAAHPLGCVGSGADVANAVIFLLSSASLFITGHTMAVDGGLALKDSFSTAMSVNTQ